MPIPFDLVKTHSTNWIPDDARVALNARLDGRIVPSAAAAAAGPGARVAYSHAVVLDGFFGEPERVELLDFLTAPGWDHSLGAPAEKWERATSDGAGMPRTWGLKPEVLRQLAVADLPALREVHSRLAKLYPEYVIAHMPSDAIQGAAPPSGAGPEGSQPPLTAVSGPASAPTAAVAGMSPGLVSAAAPGASTAAAPLAAPAAASGRGDGGAPEQARSPGGSAGEGGVPEGAEADGLGGGDPAAAPGGAAVDCNRFVGNAATHSESGTYQWHVDADPSGFPDSPWTAEYGDYCNGEPGAPLFVSLILYLNETWPREWDAETLILDAASDSGIFVRPKRYRALLMDQDVVHRVSAPSAAAGAHARYSLVWKLVFLPRRAGQKMCLARPEWGPAAAFGSAATLDGVKRELSRKRKAEQDAAPLAE